MTLADWVRVGVIFMCFFCTGEVFGFLTVYYKTVIPLKVQLEATGGRLLAPPIWLVFWYHILVGCMSATVGGGLVYNAHNNLPVNPATFVLAVILPALMLVKQRFLAYYIKLLQRQRKAAA